MTRYFPKKGNIAYSPDRPLDESCYREVNNADIFVIIIGGRYGSEKSETKSAMPKSFFEKYDSITKQEYRSNVGKLAAWMSASHIEKSAEKTGRTNPAAAESELISGTRNKKTRNDERGTMNCSFDASS